MKIATARIMERITKVDQVAQNMAHSNHRTYVSCYDEAKIIEDAKSFEANEALYQMMHSQAKHLDVAGQKRKEELRELLQIKPKRTVKQILELKFKTEKDEAKRLQSENNVAISNDDLDGKEAARRSKNCAQRKENVSTEKRMG